MDKEKKWKHIVDKQRHEGYYVWIKNMSNYCNLRNLFYYVKTNIIRAPLEALLTLYLFETWIIFTEFFTKSSIGPSETVYMIFFPLAVVAIVCLVYSIVAALVILFWVYKKVDKYKGVTNKKDKILVYFTIDRSFSRVIGVVHIIGVLCYGLIAYFMAYIFSNNVFANITDFDNNRFILYLSVIGIISGTFWNIYGYHSDRRLDWSKIYLFLKKQTISSNNDIQIWKLRYYKNSLLLQIMIAITIITFVSYILINFRFGLFAEYKEIDELLSYSAFVTLFISVITLYIKQMYLMFFSSKNDQSLVFPKIYDFSFK